MNVDFNSWGPATVLICLVTVIAMAGGIVVVIVHPETLTFRQYLDDLWKFALAVAGLAGARAHFAHAQPPALATPPQPDQGDAGHP